MRRPGVLPVRLLRWSVLSAVCSILLEAVRLAAGAPFSWSSLLTSWVFIAGLFFAAGWIQPYFLGKSLVVWPWPSLLAVGAGIGAALLYASKHDTTVAWILLAVVYLLLFALETALTGGVGALQRWGARALLAVAAGVIPTAIAQVESHFAGEEFFVALEAAVLGVFWLLLLLMRDLVVRQKPSSRAGLCIERRWLLAVVGVIVSAGAWGAVRSYQRSFYPPVAPTYLGVSAEAPFVCDDRSLAVEPFDGTEVLNGLLAGVAANPQKGPPEYGMLAVGTGDQRWGRAFRESLLAEAAVERFTEPAHSVKSSQYLAALRAYYLPRVQAQFPRLFSEQELALLRDWFAAINRRAMTVEWVDWLYALAFSKWPEGPYENQEIGAGLLALLQSGNLAAPELSNANRDYLDRNQRGWLLRFRNTDDAFIYQPEWINNAYFQALNNRDTVEDNVRRSFDWMLLQALPDGALPWYNHPAKPAYVGIAYLGAELLKDSRHLWLAGQALMRAKDRGDPLWAQPGIEEPVRLTSQPSLPGSCLLYGGSGLPNQVGPLAPDKIVLRDGWSGDATYLMLNLRFTGWHRYKATNTVSLVYQAGPLATDVMEGEPFAWLPEGRSLFRDKRIPRENLNGLLVGRTGMSAVLYALTGIGGPWAQDPPYYAEVVAFETGDERDWTHTRITDWRGWQNDRWVYFYHKEGPIAIVDESTGPAAGRAELIWHLIGDADGKGARIRLRNGDNPAEFVFVPILPAEQGPVIKAEGTDPVGRVVSYPAANGKLRAATVFLVGPWVGAQVELDAQGQILNLVQDEKRVALSLPWAQ